MKMTMTSAGSRNIPAIITLPKNTDEKYSLAVWSSPLWMWIVIKRLAIVFSAIGNYKARGEAGGAGLSMAGLILGTMVVTLVLAMTALLIVAAATALA